MRSLPFSHTCTRAHTHAHSLTHTLSHTLPLRAGLLHAMVLFLLYIKLRGGNAIGGARLDGPTVALGTIFLEAGDVL